MSLSYEIAKDLLTEVEKDRIVCTYLNATEPNAIDWEKASREYGAASVESYKKGMQNTTKKIKKAMEDGGAVATTEGSPAKKGGKKRKGKAAEVENEVEDEVEETPKKKKGRKSKAQKEAEAEAAAADEDDGVKAEANDD